MIARVVNFFSCCRAYKTGSESVAKLSFAISSHLLSVFAPTIRNHGNIVGGGFFKFQLKVCITIFENKNAPPIMKARFTLAELQRKH